MSARRVWLKVHQYTGLAAALFLVVIGLSGAVLAFENDYDRWFNPSLWRANPGARMPASVRGAAHLGEQGLVDLVEHQFGDSAGNRVAKITLGGDDVAQVFEMTDGLRVYVDPYTRRINGTRRGPAALERFLLDVRNLHTRLLAGERGRLTVDAIAALVVFLLVPVGLFLWWNKRRSTVAWRASWKRVNWDLHSVVGIYSAVFFLILGVSGVLLGFEAPLYWLVRSAPAMSPKLPRSTLPADSTGPQARRLSVDAILAAADSALPAAGTYEVLLPMRPRSVFQVLKHSPPAGKSSVALDQYSGKVLLLDDFARDSRALRAHTIDQAMHLGTIGGFGTQLLAAISGLALALAAATGTIIWWTRMAR